MTDTVYHADVVLIDGNHALHRILHSNKGRLKASSGLSTGGVLGVVELIHGYLRDYHPKHAVVCWDAGPYLRERLYPAYKADRRKKLDPKKEKEKLEHEALFHHQKGLLVGLLPKLGVRQVALKGLEADDLLWRIPRMGFWAPETQYVACSADKDLIQVVDDYVMYDRVYFQDGEPIHEVTTAANFIEVHGMTRDNFVMAKALVGGDDNIEGVKGVGPVTCTKLFELTGPKATLKRIKRACENSSDKRIRAILGQWSRLKRNLALMDLSHVDYTEDMDTEIRQQLKTPVRFDQEEVYDLFSTEYEFRAVLKRWSYWKREFTRLRTNEGLEGEDE